MTTAISSSNRNRTFIRKTSQQRLFLNNLFGTLKARGEQGQMQSLERPYPGRSKYQASVSCQMLSFQKINGPFGAFLNPHLIPDRNALYN
jgi:hypothetical protein